MLLNLITPIKTMNKSIQVKGKVFYNDRRRRIDIKKPIRDLFESSAQVGYVMELCLSELGLIEKIKILEEKGIKPILMYFVEGQEDA